MLAVDIGHHIVERTADRNQIGYLLASAGCVHNSHKRQSSGTIVQTIGRFVAMAFKEHTEASARCLYRIIICTFGHLDYRLGLLAEIALGNIVYKLLDNRKALQNLTQTNDKTGIAVAVFKYDFVEIHTVVCAME